MNEFLMAAFPIALIWLGYSIYRAMRFDKPSDRPSVAESTVDGPIKYPGYMPYKDNHGCKVVEFANIRDMNNYFAPDGAGWLKTCCEIIPTKDGSILAVITNVLSEEEKAEVAEWSYERHTHFEAKRELAREQKRKEWEAQEQAKEEAKFYEELGRKYSKGKNDVKLLAPGSKERAELEEKLKKGQL